MYQIRNKAGPKNPSEKKIWKTRPEKPVYFSIISSEKEKAGFGQGGGTAGHKWGSGILARVHGTYIARNKCALHVFCCSLVYLCCLTNFATLFNSTFSLLPMLNVVTLWSRTSSAHHLHTFFLFKSYGFNSYLCAMSP